MKFAPALCCGMILLARTIAQEGPITIKAQMHHNRFILPGKIQERAYSFLLDSACTIPTLHPSVVDELKLEESGSVAIEGIAGNERAPTYRGVVMDFGPTQYRPRRVASIPSEREESRRRRDGVIGSGFFRNYVVEMDARAETVRLYSPTNFNYSGKGEVLNFRFKADIPVVEASIVLSNRAPVVAEYEIDTGCDSGLCLGAGFVRENKLLESLQSRSSEKFGIGGSVETRNARIPIFKLGKVVVENPQTDFFQNGSPVEEPLAGHIGAGVLSRYRVIFNYSKRQIIFEAY